MQICCGCSTDTWAGSPHIRPSSGACPRPLCRCSAGHTRPASRAAGVAALLAGAAPQVPASGQERWGPLGRRAEAEVRRKWASRSTGLVRGAYKVHFNKNPDNSVTEKSENHCSVSALRPLFFPLSILKKLCHG